MRRIVLAAIATALLYGTADAALVTSTSEFHHGDKDMLGYLDYDDSHPGPRPGVLLLHGWSGPETAVKARAEQLARLGFVAFAADIYRRGELPQTAAETIVDARNFKRDRPLFEARAKAALELLGQQPQVDPGRIVVIGYGFAGLTAHDLGCGAGAVRGVVLLDTPLDQPLPTASGCSARQLLLQGGTAAEPELLPALLRQLPPGGDWQLNLYGGTGATTDHRSWTALLQFLAEMLGPEARR